MSDSDYHIRAATPADAGEIARLIDRLAAYENLSHESVPDADALRRHLDPSANPRCGALLAVDGPSERPIGFALYYFSYSTFLTRFGLHLEDLFVDSDRRGKGVGTALFAHVVAVAKSHGCRRVEWSVLKWNEGAIRFYKRLGAEAMSPWTKMRLSGAALDDFAAT